MPVVSVIVPVYKVETYLSRCVASILAQTFSDFDLILVDDGSPDNCGAICDEYAKTDSRIHVIHQENGGLSAARNTGIDWAFANSGSQWLTFIDSDDWVHPLFLDSLLQAALTYDTQISQCRYFETDGKSEVPAVEGEVICVSPEEQYIRYYAAFAWGKLYKKSIFSSLRYPVGKLYEDVAIWYKILFSCEKIAIVNRKLYYYFQRTDSIVQSDWTPKRLSRIQAWDSQMAFFRSYGNEQLLSCAARRYCWIAEEEFRSVRKSGCLTSSEKWKYSSFFRFKIRHVLCRYRDCVKISPRYKTYFGIAFPVINVISPISRNVITIIRSLLRSVRKAFTPKR